MGRKGRSWWWWCGGLPCHCITLTVIESRASPRGGGTARRLPAPCTRPIPLPTSSRPLRPPTPPDPGPRAVPLQATLSPVLSRRLCSAFPQQHRLIHYIAVVHPGRRGPGAYNLLDLRPPPPQNRRRRRQRVLWTGRRRSCERGGWLSKIVCRRVRVRA